MQIKNALKDFSYQLAIAFLGFSVLGVLIISGFLPARADNPTFFFSNSVGCGSVVSTLTAGLGDTPTIYVCIDGNNEGAGLLGAETHISYPTSSVSVSNIQCNVFDTCIDLSEYGTVKLLAASGPLPDGKAVTTQKAFGSFILSFDSVGETAFNFGFTQVINADQEVENRSGIGITINVIEGEVIKERPAVEMEKELPMEEEAPAEEESVTAEGTEISSIVISPVSNTAKPGSVVQIISRAYYTDDRPSENITSCFPCPTPNNSANGTTTYNIVSGPGSFTGSKVAVSDTAVPGQIIVFNAHYADNISGDSGLSGNSSITVISSEEEPAEKEVEKPIEEGLVKEIPIGERKIPAGEEGTIYKINEAYEAQALAEEKVAEAEAEGSETAIHEAASPNYEEEAEKALTTQTPQANSDIEIPSAVQIGKYYDDCSLSTSNNLDSDQDGLSDRTECYLNTDQNNPDTDGDGCWDGEEINRFYSNPRTNADCSIKQITEEKVIIVDPKPDWIVKTFDISGTAPLKSQRVGITASPAVHLTLNPVIDDLGGLNVVLQSETVTEEDVNVALSELEADLPDLNEFLGKYTQEYESLTNTINKISDYIADGASEVMATPEKAKALSEELMTYQTQAVLLGEVTELQELGTGRSVMAGFHLVPESILEDAVYDLIATAQLDDGTILSSPAVRVVLDSTVEVPVPTPQSIDSIPIIDITGQTEIKSDRPVLAGQSLYGAQVFATWESLVLASSIIADSAEGGFDIQSPRELEKDLNHTVTLFAVNQQAAGKVRSESVTVDFIVGKSKLNFLYWILGILVLIVLATSVAKKRMITIDHIAPEHRSKENELYEAFGVEKPHEKELPEDHSEKQEEIEEAFGALEVDVEGEKPEAEEGMEK